MWLYQSYYTSPLSKNYGFKHGTYNLQDKAAYDFGDGMSSMKIAANTKVTMIMNENAEWGYINTTNGTKSVHSFEHDHMVNNGKRGPGCNNGVACVEKPKWTWWAINDNDRLTDTSFLKMTVSRWDGNTHLPYFQLNNKQYFRTGESRYGYFEQVFYSINSIRLGPKTKLTTWQNYAKGGWNKVYENATTDEMNVSVEKAFRDPRSLEVTAL